MNEYLNKLDIVFREVDKSGNNKLNLKDYLGCYKDYSRLL